MVKLFPSATERKTQTPEKAPELELRSEPATDRVLENENGCTLGISVFAPEWEALLLDPETARLKEMLEIVWADTGLWKRVRANAEAGDISAYLLSRYGLNFPPWPALAWTQMVFNPDKRDVLFQRWSICYEGRADPNALDELKKKLPDILAGKLVWAFLASPAFDHRDVIASQRVSASTLNYLQTALGKLYKAIAWCIDNPGVVPSQSAPKPVHRPPDVGRARLIEKMVRLLLENPRLTDKELADGNAAITAQQGRKLAAEARILVELRELRTVKRYSEIRDGRVVGRKPSRTSKNSAL
jgi:hypothetical protein